MPVCIFLYGGGIMAEIWAHIEDSRNIVIQYFYTLQNDHYPVSSYPLSPYKIIPILLTIFPTLYIISP